MRRAKTRGRHIVVATLLSLAWALIPSPCGSRRAAAEALVAPDRDQLAVLEELARWVSGGADPARTAGEPLRSAIRRRAASFELFRGYHDRAEREQLLEAVRYRDCIVDASRRHGVDPLLVAAIVEVESHFDASAVSPRGALGLMQVRPATAGRPEEGQLLDPAVNVEAGTAYLRRLLDRYGGDLVLTLAAYNSGPTAVRRFGGLPPFPETRRYVEQVLRVYVAHCRRLWWSDGSRDLTALFRAPATSSSRDRSA